MRNNRVKEEMDQQIKKFLKGEECTFPGWETIKKDYEYGLNHLPPGCTPCQKNAVKRKFAAKIEKIFRKMDVLISRKAANES